MKTIDTQWQENTDKIEGPYGIQMLVTNAPDLFSRLNKAVNNRDGLPIDMDTPQTMTEVEAVGKYAHDLYCLFEEGMGIAEDLMIEGQVEKQFEDIMNELGDTESDHDRMGEAGQNSGDF